MSLQTPVRGRIRDGRDRVSLLTGSHKLDLGKVLFGIIAFVQSEGLSTH